MSKTATPPGLPVVCIIGWSGSGKTTLIGRLLPLLNQAGLRVGVIKHTHHDVAADRPGKDSWQARQAGASQVLLAGPRQCALFMDSPGAGEDPQLAALVALMDTGQLDLLLVEGMKYADAPKIEIHRQDIGRGWLYPEDQQILALVSDAQPPAGIHPPCYSPDQVQALAELLQRMMPRS